MEAEILDIRPFIEEGRYISRNYHSEEDASLQSRMDSKDYFFYIMCEEEMLYFVTKEKVQSYQIKQFDWKVLWERLGDIPVDENEEIEESYLHFDEGANKYDIWHWFEWFFDISLGKELNS